MPQVFPIGCVVMASGLGVRFGGNKLLADLNGRPLLDWVLDATDDLFAHRVVVTRHAEVAALCQARGIRFLLHDLSLRSDTVCLGVEDMPPDVTGCIFCPGDQPLISRDTLRRLAEGAQTQPDAIWRAAFQGQPGAPVLFPRWAFSELTDLPAGKGGSVLARRYPDRVRCVEATQACELMDADTPEALDALRILSRPPSL